MRRKKSDLQVFRWPRLVFPRIALVGRFAIRDKNFSYVYDTPVNALYLHDYGGRARIGDLEFEFQKGDVILSPAGVGASFDLPVGGYNFCIHFDSPPGKTRDLIQIPIHCPLGSLGDFASQKCWHIFNLLTQPKSKADAKVVQSAVPMGSLSRVPKPSANPIVQASASAALQELLLWLSLRNQPHEDKPERGRAEQVVQIAVQWLGNHMDQPLHVPALAKELGISHNYLARRFREHFGVTIPRYFLVQRIEHALNLLKTTSMPVKSVGNLIGMPDPHHFNKQFRRLVGKSPSAIRKSGPQKKALSPKRSHSRE